MTRVVVLICFLAAFAAGLTVGIQSRHAPASPSPSPERRSGWLAGELKLTPDQEARLNKIWSEYSDAARRSRGEREEQRRRLMRERDEAVAALIPAESKERYEEVRKNFTEQLAAMDREMQEAFQNAVDQTKQILTAEQREKYETIMKNRSRGPGGRDWDRGPRGRDRRGRAYERGRQGDDRATSQPVSSQPD